jgi:phage-related protein
MKPVEFLGGSLAALRAFPPTARQHAGYQLDRVQRGLEPSDWKPMPTVGPGASEIRVRDDAGAFRVVYVANRPDAIYVLHCFKKTGQRTSRPDIEIAAKRYKGLG